MDDIRVIYLPSGNPLGIRNKNGFLCFFPSLTKYSGQEERYRNEVRELHALANFLKGALQEREKPDEIPA